MPSGSSPRPWTQFSAKTVFLRVPVEDWAAVSVGTKTEFRIPGRPAWALRVKPPTPVVAYAQHRNGVRVGNQLMLLEQTRSEPLGYLTDEALAREGFPDFAHFRRYWMKRRKEHFRPGDLCQVFRVRRITTDEYDYLGRLLLARLYGEHL